MQCFRRLVKQVSRIYKLVMESAACTDTTAEKRKLELDFLEHDQSKKLRCDTETLPSDDVEKVRKPKTRKFAILLSYSGVGYLGMQINGDFPTVEKDLFSALKSLEVVEDTQPGSFRFQRAARTDKGVSAVRQICSIALRITDEDLKALPEKINLLLPPKVKVIGFKRATKGFDAKIGSSARTYSYTMPTYAFAHCDELTDETFRMDENRLKEVNDILKIYRGTHNFFNFTSGKEHSDRSCNRYIIDCECGPPFCHENVEFATIRLKGQSFMMHQIRKMVGLCIAIVRGLADKSAVQRAWEAKRADVPKAPGLGLLLEKVHYEGYDKKFGKDHQLLDSWEEYEETIQKHKEIWILPTILEGEIKHRSMFDWLATLPLHSFEDSDETSPTHLRDALLTLETSQVDT